MLRGVSLELAAKRRGQAVGRRHHQRPVDAGGAQPGERAEHHAGLIGVAEHRGTCHQPADVATGGGVRDHPHADHGPTVRRRGCNEVGRPRGGGAHAPTLFLDTQQESERDHDVAGTLEAIRMLVESEV
jgi:hypothetical protein